MMSPAYLHRLQKLIAHSSNYFRGNRDTRARATLKKMGPAVFNGGISTLIAVLMLMNSRSYVFVAYFKVLTQFPNSYISLFPL